MMKHYDYYKTTDIPWLNKIPEHWNELRGKFIYQKVVRPPKQNDEVVTCFRDGQVTLRKNRRLTGFTESIKEIGYQHIKQGDLVIHVMDAFAGAIGVSDSNGKGSPVYNVCISKMCTNNYFYAYLLREMARNGYISSLYRGIRERSSDFRFNVFSGQLYPIPPREEQDKIVAYLDYQTSNINKLILNKRKQIELLEEYKKTKISEVVTKGLYPNVEMKDSGIDWIGQIPKHWEIKKLKYILKIKKAILPSRISNRGKTPYLTLEYLRNIVSTNYFADDGTYADIESIILVWDGSNAGEFIFEHPEGYAASTTAVLKIKDNYYKNFMQYFLKSFEFILRLQIKGMGIPHVNGYFLKNSSILIPTLLEQKEIADYLDNLTLKLDNLVDKHKLYIEKLEEYKKTLISDVVTGKIDIRDITIPKYEKVEIVDNIKDNANIDELNME